MLPLDVVGGVSRILSVAHRSFKDKATTTHEY